MEIELKNANLSVSDGEVAFFPAVKPADKGEFPSIGARGCFLSHLEILKQAHLNQLDTVLFMEDDLAVSNQLPKFMPILQESLATKPWSILYLGHIENLVSPSDREFELVECDKNRPIRTTHFYAVNSKVVPRLIAFLEKLLQRPAGHPEGGPMHYDGALNTFRSQNADIITLLANPNLGWQRSSRSDIADIKWFDSMPVINEFVAQLRKFKNLLKKPA